MLSKLNKNFYLEDLIKTGNKHGNENPRNDIKLKYETNYHTTPILSLRSTKNTLHVATYFSPEYTTERPLILVRLTENEREEIGTYNAYLVDPSNANTMEIIALESYLNVSGKNKDKIKITTIPYSYENAFDKNDYIKELKVLEKFAFNSNDNKSFFKFNNLLTTLKTFPKKDTLKQNN